MNCRKLAQSIADDPYLLTPDQWANEARQAIQDDIQSTLDTVANDLHGRNLVNTLKNARACLLNLQSDEYTPIDAQMQKMVGEISLALGDFEPFKRNVNLSQSNP